MVLEKRRHYKPNVAYELLIDGKYHYYGSHCRKRSFIYGSTIKANSGNALIRSVLRGEITRKEYNERARLINVWEFDTPEEALDKERELITLGKMMYGDSCYNLMEGNNKDPVCPEELKQRLKKLSKAWADAHPEMREFFKACGKKGIKNNPVMLRSKKIGQYKDNVLINVYPSLCEASRVTGIDVSNIRKTAHNRQRSAGGFVWKFLTDMDIQEKTGA